MSRTRFAPSPTGDLHLGGAWTALASWALARATGGRTVLRIEDLDPPRVLAGSAERIADDLDWLGLDSDEGPEELGGRGGRFAPYMQSERAATYARAALDLEARGLVYRCDCSRAEIARAASAPHAGEEVVYPGTCRDLPQHRAFKRPPALRLRVPRGDERTVTFDDACRGRIIERVDESAGDFVLRRGDGVFAYQLAVAVDDADMEIDLVVRGDDLLGSTARQLLLLRLLGRAHTPRYAHLPLVVAHDGERLAKRTRGATVRELRARGLTPEELLGELARGLGIAVGAGPRSAPEVATELGRALEVDADALTRWRKTPWRIPPGWA
jgi:glutamyl-tRNA synthetase